MTWWIFILSVLCLALLLVLGVVGTLHYVSVMQAQELDARRREDDMLLSMDPRVISSKRESIRQRREILLGRRALYLDSWEKKDRKSEADWNGMLQIDGRLEVLAKEESEIPMLPPNSES